MKGFPAHFRRSPPAGFIRPAEPTLVAKPRAGPGWVHEVKHDGCRLLATDPRFEVREDSRSLAEAEVAAPSHDVWLQFFDQLLQTEPPRPTGHVPDPPFEFVESLWRDAPLAPVIRDADRKSGGRVVLWSRYGTDLTDNMPRIAAAVRALPVADALLDGEAVVFRPDGYSDFAALRTKRGAAEASLVAFDLREGLRARS
jgi:ATP-dependent DNA ligase